MKACSTCGREKPGQEFQKRAASKDGLTASCRDCLKARDAARYPREKERRAAWHKAYIAGPGKQIHANCVKSWQRRNANKRAAHIILGNAVRDGKIKKMPCEVCGAKAHAHHDDYTKPLDVRWLCIKHHAEHHKTMRRNSAA